MFAKDDQLHNFDIFPKIFAVGKETEISIRSLGCRDAILPEHDYTLTVCAMNGGNPADFPATAMYVDVAGRSDADRTLRFSFAFPSEQEYFVDIKDAESGRRLWRLNVYAVGDGLIGRYPFIGDLHVHSNMSDGGQAPEVVCAVYRGHGYDFMAITDHHRYHPSIRAIRTYRDIPTELCIVPGEEVHLPQVCGFHNDTHVVNFGGEYSVNALVDHWEIWETKDDPSSRSLDGVVRPVMTQDEFSDCLAEYMKGLDIPEGIDPVPAAATTWTFGQIKKAGGLAIFAHPYWQADVFHVPEALVDYLMERHDFDAFEVLGGENYYEQNGFQTVRYYEDMAKGHRYPVVGSTDSHNCYPSNRNAYICSTIVFSPENERKAIIQSVRDYYSVAVDTISKEFRMVGESRLIRYGCFLLKYYFPIHDELCFEEGRLMKVAVTGTDEEKADAVKMLSAMNGRMAKLREKYFGF